MFDDAMTCNVYTFVPFSFELFFVFYNTCFVFVCGSVVICIDSARLGRKKILDDHSVMTMRTEERMQPIVYCSSIFHLESKNCLSFFFSFFFFLFHIPRCSPFAYRRTREHRNMRAQKNKINQIDI